MRVQIPEHEMSCVTSVFVVMDSWCFLEVNLEESPAGFFSPACEVHILFFLPAYVCISESL